MFNSQHSMPIEFQRKLYLRFSSLDFYYYYYYCYLSFLALFIFSRYKLLLIVHYKYIIYLGVKHLNSTHDTQLFVPYQVRSYYKLISVIVVCDSVLENCSSYKLRLVSIKLSRKAWQIMENIKDEVTVRNCEDDLNNYNDRASWTKSISKRGGKMFERLLRWELIIINYD